jgi:hypothetical protein
MLTEMIQLALFPAAKVCAASGDLVIKTTPIGRDRSSDCVNELLNCATAVARTVVGGHGGKDNLHF